MKTVVIGKGEGVRYVGIFRSVTQHNWPATYLFTKCSFSRLSHPFRFCTSIRNSTPSYPPLSLFFTSSVPDVSFHSHVYLQLITYIDLLLLTFSLTMNAITYCLQFDSTVSQFITLSNFILSSIKIVCIIYSCKIICILQRNSTTSALVLVVSSQAAELALYFKQHTFIIK